MKVLVIGANGKVARHFADLIKDHDTIQEKAMVRKGEQKPFFEERGIETVQLDLAKNSIEELSQAAQGMDAVIFTAGAGGKGLEKTIQIDLDGAIKTMTASEQAGVKRFIMVSTFRTGREEMDQDTPLRTYTIAKHYADEWLKHRTDLDWTIIHPGILIDESGTGTVQLGTGQEINKISRQDVARILLAVLKNDSTIKKEFEVLSGDIPIATAIKTI